MKKLNFLLILFKLLKLNIFGKVKVSDNGEIPFSNSNINPGEVKEMHTGQENSVLLSDAPSENETLHESNNIIYSQVPGDTNNLEIDSLTQLSKENQLKIENIPDLNNDGIVDIRDIIIAVIQAIEKYEDFNDY